MHVLLQLLPNSSDCDHPLPHILSNTLTDQLPKARLVANHSSSTTHNPPPSALPALQRPGGDLTSSGERPPLHCALPSSCMSCRPQSRETRPTLRSHDLGYFSVYYHHFPFIASATLRPRGDPKAVKFC